MNDQLRGEVTQTALLAQPSPQAVEPSRRMPFDEADALGGQVVAHGVDQLLL